jgi:undecaprenyl-diphosphatase
VNIFEAVILGIVEGVTEFLPVSSTGHLTIMEKLLDLPVDDEGVTAFTAVIQIGAIAAVFVYFWADVVRICRAFFRGVTRKSTRTEFDYKFAWYVIVGSIPIGIVGFAAKSLITGPLRSLWVVAGALIVWSAVMVFAEYVATQKRSERDLTMRDAIVIGLAQCFALVPGVSRSGATISAGLLRGIDRLTATKLSFFLSIPALTAAGLYEGATQVDAIGNGVGWLETIIATIVSFVVAYISVAWLLKFVVKHSIGVFAGYRVLLGCTLIVLLTTGVITAT